MVAVSESRTLRTIRDLPRDAELTAIQERQRRAARTKKLIVAYNAPFERRCVRELQEQLPHLAEETLP